jgi:hypothetical protein
MQPTLITTTAGPLGVTHLDFWKPTIEHTQDDTFIRLTYVDSAGAKIAATVMVGLVKREAALESLLQDASLHLQAEPGVSDIRVTMGRDLSDNKVGRIHYRLAVAPESPATEGALFGFIALRRFNHQTTRFDFVAEKEFFEEHYRETLIMSTTVELVN